MTRPHSLDGYVVNPKCDHPMVGYHAKFGSCILGTYSKQHIWLPIPHPHSWRGEPLEMLPSHKGFIMTNFTALCEWAERILLEMWTDKHLEGKMLHNYVYRLCTADMHTCGICLTSLLFDGHSRLVSRDVESDCIIEGLRERTEWVPQLRNWQNHS